MWCQLFIATIIAAIKDNSSWLSIATCLLTIVAQALASEPRVVCYYTNWSVYRPGTAKFNPQNINPYLCTHLVYAFGGFTKDNTLKPFDQYQDIEKGGYAKFTGLKTYNKNLKTMLAIGGWNEGSARFSPLVASRERRKEFVRNAIKFLRQNRFDGLDLDWEYPAFRDGGKAKDRENYAKLVKELREEFERESEKTGRPRLLLTMAVPAGIEYIAKGFDIKTLNRYLDWMNLLSYDYHSAFEPAVNHHAPLYPIEEPNEYSVDNELNINYTIQYYIENGADRNKLVLGIPTYGRSYTLFNPEATEIGAPADGPGEQGDATREKGYLAYYEICESLKPKEKKVKRAIADESDEDSEEEEEEEEEEEDQEWTIIHPNSNAMGPVAYRGNQWVGYDDVDIVQKKAEYVADNGLGGIMFWSIDNDDFRGNCHGKPYPLIEAAKEAYISKVGSTDNVVVSERPKSSSSRRNRPRVTAKPSTTTRAPQSNKRKSSLSSTTPSWNVQTPEPPTTPDPGSDFKCTEEGFFQHPRDCKKYFWCLDSGPSNLGIVAHQFTCPSGLFFNKAADSCDFARNVLCKKGSTTTKSPITSKPTTARTTTTTNEPSTTKKPFVISTRNSLLFRTTTTTTTPEPIEEEEEISDEEVDTSDVDAEDPRVIKELIDLIKKVGGVEQLEKHLHLAETSMNTGSVGTTTPATFNKKLYQKVLERTRKNKFNAESAPEKSNLNSRRGPQNAGLERNPEATAARKDRPQYTTINRSRPSPSTTTEETVEAIVEEVQDSPRYIESREETGTKVGTTSKPLQYVNIRRARPSSQFSTDTADDTASRNALFERNEPIIPESQSSPNAINTKRESIPEYVTIRRQRPTTEETTTVQYDSAELSVEESLNSKRIENETVSSPSSASQPQYTSILRVRSTTVAAQTEESVNTPEPTTVLAVQLSSLLNNPVSTETEVPDEELTSAETTLTTEPSSTTSTTTVPSSRRPAFRRRGSTTSTTPVSTSSTTSQVSSEKAYTFVRRRPQLRPNEITPDLVGSSDIKTSRKIRSTTPDSREGLEIVKPQRESNQVQKRYRFRLEGNQEDAVPAAATTVSRGQFRPRLSRDELISLTPIDNEKFEESPRDNINQRVQRVERRFRPRVTTVTDQVEDSDVSAATVELRRPNILPRGRNKFIPSSTEAAPARNFEQTYRRPTISRFTPRPFTSPLPIESTPFTNRPDDDSLKEPSYTINNLQARKLPYLDEDEEKHDIDLSESSIEEKEHVEETETDVAPKRRIVIKKIRTSIGTTESTKLTTNLVSNEPEDSTNTDDVNKQKRVKIIRRRPTSTINPESNSPTSSPDFLSSTSVPPRIRKIIRKKLRTEPESQTKNYTYEPEILSKTTESLESLNYGDKSKPTTQTISTTTIETTTTTTTNTPIEISSTTEAVETDLDDSEDTLSSEKENSSEYIQDEKPLVIIQNKEEADISDNEDDQITTLESSKPPTEASTASSTLESSPTPRSRLPYRPPKRLFTSSTEPPLSFSSRTYSRKYNGRVYTTPATADKNSEQSRSTSSRRPLFSSRPFSRKPFTTARTTTKVEEDFDDEDYESQEDQSEEENFEVLPEEKFFTRKPYQDQNAKDDSQNDSALSSKKPTFRLKSINSNTFRTSALTTELPARHSTASVNISSILNRFSDKGNDSKKRVQNVPAGYSAPKAETITEKSKLITTESTDKEIDESTENSFENVTTTEDDYLTNFDVTTTDATSTDSNTDVTEKVNEVHTTQLSNFDIYADDYLEASDDTTINPEDIFATFDFSDEKSTTLSQDITTDERTAETTDEPELLTTTVKLSSASPVFETYFDKLFSIRRVEEVSSKLNKHRVNKNNESRLIESGEIMQEKKPTEVKIGEVSRYSLIKIVEGDIPIYLTKLGHVYPVENPPDNLIRIDEARNARSLLNFSEAGKENLIASESINKAYHTNNIASIPVESETSKEVEQSRNDDFLSFINEDKISDDSAENQSLWQFVPAAYENERSRQNKEAKSFEIITPRNVLTNPSTLPLEALFKTEIPVLQIARKVTLNENNSQPFVVYSSTLSEMKENDNPKKMENIRSELAHNIKTYVKGQELNGASSTEEADVMYPVYVSATTKETEAPLLTTTNAPPTSEATNSNSTKLLLSTIAEIEETTIAATTFATTTETILEDTTTQKLSLVDALSENAKKRPKFAFPRRPNFKTSNVTRPPLSTSPRTTKKLSTLSLATSPSRLNKTSGFNPTKSRFTSNRAQNVPIELRSSRKSNIVPSKNFTTEAPKQISTTERKPVFKPFRPNIRPAFVPRRSTTLPPTTQTTQGVKRQRPNFLRRSKTTPRPTEATESSDNDLTTEFSTIVENTTSKYTRRGQSRFRNRSEAKLDEARKRVNTTASAQKSDAGKSTRTAVRRRLSGTGATTTTTPIPSSSRRPFRVASRRRPFNKTITTTTASPTTTVAGSDEYLQDLDEKESIEEPDLKPRRAPLKKTVKVQRRPLTSLKEAELKLKDQNPSASSDDQGKRQSKKYSSSFKQNQLDEVIRQKTKSEEEMEDTTATTEDFSPETAVVIAAHQLLAAPLPSTSYDDDYTSTTSKKHISTKSTQKSTITNIDPYGYTTDGKLVYSNNPTGYTSTPSYATTSRSPSSLILQPSTEYIRSGVLSNSDGFSGVSQPQLGVSTARYLGTSDKYLSIPVEEFGYSTEGYIGGLSQEPVYFTREYLLESPVTRTYDDEYQYLSPVTTPSTTTRKIPKKTVHKRISTTQRPTTQSLPVHVSTVKPRRVPQKKAFDKILKEPKKIYKPIENYDYYDDSNEKIVNKYDEGTKVVVHGKGSIECLDIGNFPHPTSCKKFISCARMESGAIVGWEYVCPIGLSFDPVGGMCNWSAGLGCDEN